MKNAIAQDAGIVDEDVDAAEGFERRLHDFVAVGRVADRQRRGDRVAAGLFDLVHDQMRRRCIGTFAFEARTNVADDDTGALLRHQERDAAADAAPRTSDDSDLALDNSRH